MSKSTCPARGFATFSAIVLTGLLAIALASMSAVVAKRMHRVSERETAAQLDQLLLAGRSYSAMQADGIHPNNEIKILPPAFPQGSATLWVKHGDNELVVTATYNGKSASDRLGWRDGRWVVLESMRP